MSGLRDMAPRKRGFAIDALVIVTLTLAAYVTRRNGLPRDGLFHDDAWVAVGAVRGSASQFFTVGSGHPGFIESLMIWSQLVGKSATALAVPSLVAGTVGPGVLYAMLRRIGYARSVSALLGGVLVGSSVHILYSGRVKTYVFDVVIVAALALLVSRLARTRWDWRVGLLWLVAAVVLGSFSGFALAATVVGGVILVLHPSSDRLQRATFVAMQGMLQLVMFVAIQSSYDASRLEDHQESIYDGHLELEGDPLAFGAQVFRHFRRVLVVFPGGPKWLLTLCVAVMVLALVFVSFRGRRSVEARFLASLMLLAFIGGLAGIFPFGASSGNALSRGARSTLWLVPVVAIGLGAALEGLRRLLSGRRWLGIGLDATIFLAAALVVVAALQRDTLAYPFPGTASATDFLEAELREGDIAILSVTAQYPGALEVDSEVTLRASPDQLVGFAPVFSDRRFVPVQSLTRRSDVARVLDGADRVFAFIGISGFVGLPPMYQDVLDEKGFVPETSVPFDSAEVVILRRSGTA